MRAPSCSTTESLLGDGRMTTWFRLHPRGDDPRRLLDAEHQRSEPWGGTIYGQCTKCGGDGRTQYECESCRLRADPSCPACRGRKRYEAECPACGGTGEIDDSERHGVSVFPDEEGLYRYMRNRGAEIDDACLLEPRGRAES